MTPRKSGRKSLYGGNLPKQRDETTDRNPTATGEHTDPIPKLPKSRMRGPQTGNLDGMCAGGPDSGLSHRTAENQTPRVL